MFLSGLTYDLTYKALDIFLSGCKPPHCDGCHNCITWSFKYGKLIDIELIKQRVLNDFLIHRVRIMGGEPLDQPFNELLKLLVVLKETKKEIWLFTRYLPNEIDNNNLKLLHQYLHYIKHGKYIKNSNEIIQYGITLASDNQFILKIK
jgi:organic radical activating enzyme